MSQFISFIIIVLFWIISFVEPSGWAVIFHLPEKINTTIAVISVLFFLFYPNKRLPISRSLFWLILIFMVVVPYLNSTTWEGASYIVAFLAMYIVSQCTITSTVIKYTSLTISFLGLFVLYVYTRGSILSGWNDNAISMVGLFSYIYFSIFLISKRDSKSFWVWNIVTILYLMLLFETDCRSGMLFSLIAVVAIFYAKFTRKILGVKKIRLLLLNFPLLISLIVIAVAASSGFDELNRWSMLNFDKPVFNGRERLWEYSFELLEKSYYMGTGKFLLNYHNSGVAALSVFGIIGYLCWIIFFSKNLYYMSPYLSDGIVFGSMLAFLLIFLQQSVDLGFIYSYPNLLPYVILGVGVGRVRDLKKRTVHLHG